jgi:hypothetical protein
MAIFETPYRVVKYGMDNPLWWADIHEGFWVCKTADGTWRNVVCPSQDFIRSCQVAYQGGLIHEISAEEAQDLIDGGYSDYVTS